MIRPPLLACTLMTVLWASLAWADNTTCDTAEPIVVGSHTADIVAPAEQDPSGLVYPGVACFKTSLQAGRSYIFWASTPEVQGSNFDLSNFAIAAAACPVGRSCTDTHIDYHHQFEPLTNEQETPVVYASVKAQFSGLYVFRVLSFTLRPIAINVVLIETTLFSPWWFVGGRNQSFVAVRNNMAPGIRNFVEYLTIVTLTFYRSDGTICGTEDVVVPGNGNTFRRINDYPDCLAAGSGSSSITYYGSPGGVSANTTVLDVSNGTSFDVPFTPRMVWSILPRLGG